MTDTTIIILSIVSTVGGIVSSYASGRARAHATQATAAQASAVGAARYVAASLRPPSVPMDLFKSDPPAPSSPPDTVRPKPR